MENEAFRCLQDRQKAIAEACVVGLHILPRKTNELHRLFFAHLHRLSMFTHSLVDPASPTLLFHERSRFSRSPSQI